MNIKRYSFITIDIEKYKKMAGIEELEEVPDDFHEMTIA
jgi:hypothetical protein